MRERFSPFLANERKALELGGHILQFREFGCEANYSSFLAKNANLAKQTVGRVANGTSHAFFTRSRAHCERASVLHGMTPVARAGPEILVLS